LITNSSGPAIKGGATLTNDFGLGIYGEALGNFGIGIAGPLPVS